MKTSIVPIGNSKGIRIPKMILNQCRLKKEVELEPRGDELIIRSVSRRRRGWEEAFGRMAEKGDDVLLDQEATPASSWDVTEWRW